MPVSTAGPSACTSSTTTSTRSTSGRATRTPGSSWTPPNAIVQRALACRLGSVGKPRLRGRVRAGVHRRRRQPAGGRPHLHHDVPATAAGRRVLVDHHVRHPPTTTWSPIRSTGTPSGTAPPASGTPTTDRSPSPSATRSPTDPVARANWLPAPAERFRLVFRLYDPGAPVLDGSYEFPPITAG